MAKSQVLTVEASATLDELVQLEREINEGMDRYFEDEYYVAVRIKHILERKADGHEKPGLWRLVSPTFADYVSSGRLPFREKTYAYRMNRYADIRAILADELPTGNSWCEWSARPFTKKIPKQNADGTTRKEAMRTADIRRISGKIRTYLRRNDDTRLTSHLVQRFVDEDLGKQQDAASPESDIERATLPQYLRQCVHNVRAMKRHLEQVPASGWDVVEDEFPKLVKRLTAELDGLSAYLKE